MQLRLYTMEAELGTAELLPGVNQHDVVTALRKGHLFVDEIKPGEPLPAPKPPPKAAPTPKTTLPKTT